ncbi:Piso0_002681 [Millerozyma farinosa CBS 7064]|uniref:Mitochondrial glycine transporter n=1 Tax=Pichia sorbitophila (strain ATCC MYA-4447 / BCRC 22081 / CBS 7064 / NBRC 10061 / NRRL Y-12695) TaxID=559304 RepID=G8YD87_PICSO|nr:Piso0_002681 [Millerozyma farinosa CBS 7064]
MSTSASLEPRAEPDARVSGSKQDVGVKANTSTHLISGAAAGLVSAFTLQPLDLLKTRLQQQQRANQVYQPTITKELRKLTHLKELWRGVLPSTLRTSIGAGLYFTILSTSRTYISNAKTVPPEAGSKTSILPTLSPMENLLTGFGVRALVGIITMPITVIKARFESNMYSYNSMYEGFEGIYLDGSGNGQKGSVRNFFKGTLATLARDCPYAGLYVLFYESLKNDVLGKLLPVYDSTSSGDLTRSTVINTSSAVLASFMSTSITAPFDAIKTRLQLSTVQDSSNTIYSVTKQLLKEEGGIRNFFRGLSLRLGRKGLSSGISWCIYEELIKKKSFIGSLFSST